MPQQQGYLVTTSTETGKVTGERACVTCCHCNANVWLHDSSGAKLENATGWCFRCAKMTCRSCSARGCTPFEEQLARAEARGIFLRSVG